MNHQVGSRRIKKLDKAKLIEAMVSMVPTSRPGNSPHRKKLVTKVEAHVTKASRAEPCIHQGRIPLDRLGSNCKGCWIMPCELHHRCTHAKPTLGVICCQGCADYKSEAQADAEVATDV